MNWHNYTLLRLLRGSLPPNAITGISLKLIPPPTLSGLTFSYNVITFKSFDNFVHTANRRLSPARNIDKPPAKSIKSTCVFSVISNMCKHPFPASNFLIPRDNVITRKLMNYKLILSFSLIYDFIRWIFVWYAQSNSKRSTAILHCQRSKSIR